MSDISSQLEKLESIVEKFQRYRLKAGEALMEIHRGEFYEERGFSSIREYANSRFGFTKQRTYQLIKYARVVEILGGEGYGTPQNEAQARPLYRLLGKQEDKLMEAWKAVTNSHSLSDLTQAKVYHAVQDVLSEDTDNDDPITEEVGISLPQKTAKRLGLSGADHRNKRVVPWEGIERDDLDEILQETDPKTSAPSNFSDEPVIGAKAWMPLKRMGISKRIFLDDPSEEESRIQFHPRLVQQLQEARVPPHSTKRRKERSDTLACPQVDILSDAVPNVLTEEIIQRSKGTEWEPIFWSIHGERWVDHDLPDAGWIGTYTDRGAIKETAKAFRSADDTKVKWVLYDVNGSDREEGLPEVDLSVLDWIVLDTPGGSGVQLPFHQLQNISESIHEHDITLAVRDPFTTSVEATPSM